MKNTCKLRISPSAFWQSSPLMLHSLVDEVYGGAVSGARSLVMGFLQRFEGVMFARGVWGTHVLFQGTWVQKYGPQG